MRDAGVDVVIHCATSAYASKMIEDGYQLVTLASDSRHLAMAAAAEINAVRKSGTKAGVLPAY